MQNTTETQRGEIAPIHVVDELPFFATPVQTESEKQIDLIENFMADTKGQLSEMIEGMMKDMRETHERIIADPETFPEQRAASEAVIHSIQLVEDGTPVVDATEIHAQLNTVAFMKQTVLDFRRQVRRARIARLDVQELTNMIRKISDQKFRMKLILMINAVMMYAARKDRNIKDYAVFLRFQFMVIKFAAKLGYVPTMAGVLYERYSEQYHNRS